MFLRVIFYSQVIRVLHKDNYYEMIKWWVFLDLELVFLYIYILYLYKHIFVYLCLFAIVVVI